MAVITVTAGRYVEWADGDTWRGYVDPNVVDPDLVTPAFGAYDYRSFTGEVGSISNPYIWGHRINRIGWDGDGGNFRIQAQTNGAIGTITWVSASGPTFSPSPTIFRVGDNAGRGLSQFFTISSITVWANGNVYTFVIG